MNEPRERLNQLVEQIKKEKANNHRTAEERVALNRQIFSEYQKKLKSIGIGHTCSAEEHSEWK